MAARLPPEDSRPWYRQFWPWFLIALPAAVVVAGLSTLYIANIYSDDLVADDYYKDGLAINQQLDKSKRAEELGLRAQISVTNKSGGQWVEVRISGQPRDAQLQLSLSHPLEADQDFVVSLPKLSQGVYTGQLPHHIAARWYWILESVGDRPWRLNGSIAPGEIFDESGN